MRKLLLLLVGALLLSGCGAGRATSPATSVAHNAPLGPPSAADAHFLEGFSEKLGIQCSYADIGGESNTSSLVAPVEELEAIAHRVNLESVVPPQQTLRTVIEGAIRTLEKTNNFNKPVCAPKLGERLSRSTGVSAE
jgi:hypothetical protein